MNMKDPNPTPTRPPSPPSEVHAEQMRAALQRISALIDEDLWQAPEIARQALKP